MLPDEADLLLVQDNPLEVELTLRPLRDLDPGCRLAVARDGEEALDYLLGRGAFRHRLGAPLPRLVLLDLKLPRVDGVEVLRALRASPRASAAPVVMLLPASDARELAQCYQVGANSCVQKPVEFDALLRHHPDRRPLLAGDQPAPPACRAERTRPQVIAGHRDEEGDTFGSRRPSYLSDRDRSPVHHYRNSPVRLRLPRTAPLALAIAISAPACELLPWPPRRRNPAPARPSTSRSPATCCPTG